MSCQHRPMMNDDENCIFCQPSGHGHKLGDKMSTTTTKVLTDVTFTVTIDLSKMAWIIFATTARSRTSTRISYEFMEDPKALNDLISGISQELNTHPTDITWELGVMSERVFRTVHDEITLYHGCYKVSLEVK